MTGQTEDTELIPTKIEDDVVLSDVIGALTNQTEQKELRRSSAELLALMHDPTVGPPATIDEWDNALFHELVDWHREKPLRERERRLRAEEAKRAMKEERERNRRSRQARQS